MAAEPGHGGVPDPYKNYYGYNGAMRAPLHTTEEKSTRRLVGHISKNSLFNNTFCILEKDPHKEV